MIKQAYLNEEMVSKLFSHFSKRLRINTHSSVVDITLIAFLLINLLGSETGDENKASLDVFLHTFLYTHSQKDKGFVNRNV